VVSTVRPFPHYFQSPSKRRLAVRRRATTLVFYPCAVLRDCFEGRADYDRTSLARPLMTLADLDMTLRGRGLGFHRRMAPFDVRALPRSKSTASHVIDLSLW
jgi:hypothetical protein